MFSEFKTMTHAKWILAGEHAVLRGGAALVFPLKARSLSLSYEPSSELNIITQGSQSKGLEDLLYTLIETGKNLLSLTELKLNGDFCLESYIPLGAGLGASAALSVALSRWFAAQKLIDFTSIIGFSRRLEDVFHGKSSGLDIAGVAADQGLYFQQGRLAPLVQSWNPNWYLSFSGQAGLTSACIARVRQLHQEDPHLGRTIDEAMQRAVEQAKIALMEDKLNSRRWLKKAINDAGTCFKAWGLVDGVLAEHMSFLRTKGALAVKPTGSGQGGYVLSLWEDGCKPEINSPMIPLSPG